VDQANQEVTGKQKVIEDITNTPLGIPIKEYTVAQVYPMLGSFGFLINHV
jgi:hypothetical protein